MEHGAFTYYLLEGLRARAVDACGRITVQTLGRYVEDEVPRWAEKTRTPRPQTPWASRRVPGRGDPAGDPRRFARDPARRLRR